MFLLTVFSSFSSDEGLQPSLLARLQLGPSKIKTLSEGLKQIAQQCRAKNGHVGCVVNRTKIAEGLVLDKITAPIGVLMVIFESRPDCLPQVSSRHEVCWFACNLKVQSFGDFVFESKEIHKTKLIQGITIVHNRFKKELQAVPWRVGKNPIRSPQHVLFSAFLESPLTTWRNVMHQMQRG